MQTDGALFAENERTRPTTEGRRFAEIGPLDLEGGGRLEDVRIAYEEWGDPARPAVLVLHALSGDSHAVGWWDRLVGPGRALDTDRYRVVCSNVLGGCQGSTGPADGLRGAFPRITVGDMVEAQARLADRLGIARWHAVAGGSMGGMQALEWSVRFPERVERCFVTAACAAHDAMQIGFNHAAREAIRRDPKWSGGDYDPADPPRDGLSVARMLGHLSFLSAEAFDAKFGRRVQPGREVFQVESYLTYQGDKFTGRFDANSLIALTRAIDDYERLSLAGATCRYLFVSYSSDWLYPPRQAEAMHRMAVEAGCDSRHVEIPLPFGHDSFLLDGGVQGAELARWLEE